MNSSFIALPSSLQGIEAPRLMLLILRLVGLFDHLAHAIAATVLAHAVRAHQLMTGRAGNERRRFQAEMLAAVATAVARNLGFWCGTHCCIPKSFLEPLTLVCATNWSSCSIP